MTCPRCEQTLGALGRYCPHCEAYIEDLLQGDPQPSSLGVPDTRSESAVSLAIVQVLELHGFTVWSLEQGYRHERGGTRQTAGLGDLFVLGHGHSLWIELKRPDGKGRLRPSQEAFRDACRANGVAWALWRSETDALEWVEGARSVA